MGITLPGIVVICVLLLMGWNGYHRGFIKEIISFFFVFLAVALAGVLNPGVNAFIREETPIYQKIQENCMELTEEWILQKSGNEESGETIKFPETIMKELEVESVSESINDAGEKVSGSLAETIVNGLSYLISYILASLAIKAACCILDIIAGLPLIKTVNRFSGALIGVTRGVVFVWIIFLLLTVLCSTEVGKKSLELIQKDAALRLLYKYDLFVNFFAK